MRTTGVMTLACAGCLVVGAGVAGVGAAQADSVGPYAGDAIDQLSAWGYTVVLNGVGKDAGYLDSRERWGCLVTGVHPSVSGPLPTGRFQTVYVDMSCPPSNNSPTQ